jgi:hypothetical protein
VEGVVDICLEKRKLMNKPRIKMVSLLDNVAGNSFILVVI